VDGGARRHGRRGDARGRGRGRRRRPLQECRELTAKRQPDLRPTEASTTVASPFVSLRSAPPLSDAILSGTCRRPRSSQRSRSPSAQRRQDCGPRGPPEQLPCFGKDPCPWDARLRVSCLFDPRGMAIFTILRSLLSHQVCAHQLTFLEEVITR